MFLDIIILGLYFWTNSDEVNSEFSIGLTALITSIVSAVIATLSFTIISEKKYPLRIISALTAYVLLLATIGLLVVETGISSSPFLALWMIASVLGGMFGILVIIFFIVALTGYATWAGFEGLLDNPLILALILAGYLPLFISYLLWHNKSSNERTKERAYYDLASQLDQVASKSDTVINAIKDGVIAVNNQGLIELINPAAQRLAGWKSQDALRLDYKSVLQLMSRDGSEIDKASDPVFEVLTTNQPVTRDDLLLQTSSGKKVNIGIVVSPIGRIGSGVIIVFHDVTKEKADEKAQAEFISTASHEMRTPVASIEGYLGLALNPATANIDEKARGFITKAHEAVQHLGRLFQDLLDVTKADDGRISNNPKVVDVVDFTHDIVGGLEQKAKEKNLHLFFKPMTGEAGGLKNLEPAYFVNLDNDHLREIIANLVENAIKYTKEGEIIIDVNGDDTHVVVSIADSGIGIPADDIPHLFQKFYRVDSSDTREIGGTGLGLYLCRRLAEAMDGRIWVESEQGKGSKFSIELPRISHTEAQQLIEASHESVQPSDSSYHNHAAKRDAETRKHQQDALAIPIIMNKGRSAAKTAPPPPPLPHANPTNISNPPANNVPPTATPAQETLTPQQKATNPPQLTPASASEQLPHPPAISADPVQVSTSSSSASPPELTKPISEPQTAKTTGAREERKLTVPER